MDWLLPIIKEMSIGNLIANGAIVWFFYQRLDKKIDKMQDVILDIDRRLCRLEGAFQSKDCCMLNSDSNAKRTRAE